MHISKCMIRIYRYWYAIFYIYRIYIKINLILAYGLHDFFAISVDTPPCLHSSYTMGHEVINLFCTLYIYIHSYIHTFLYILPILTFFILLKLPSCPLFYIHCYHFLNDKGVTNYFIFSSAVEVLMVILMISNRDFRHCIISTF